MVKRNEEMDCILEYTHKRYEELLSQATQYQLGYYISICLDTNVFIKVKY